MNHEKWQADTQRGQILVEAAYAAGKMLNHSGWRNILPRNISPSDADMVIDNAGRILFVEFKAKTCNWNDLSKGQRLMYQNIVRAGNGKQSAACCQISPQQGKQIDTVKDVEQFQLMWWQDGEIKTSHIMSGCAWPDAVRAILRL